MGPGEGVLSPSFLGAVGVLVLNDHVLKGYGPGWLTGYLSDVAGLFFFPIFLQAILEVGLAAFGHYRRPSMALLYICVATTVLGFSVVQLSPLGQDMYRWGLGYLQWVVYSPLAIILGGLNLPPRPVKLWPDPWDLATLPICLWTLAEGRWRLNRGRS